MWIAQETEHLRQILIMLCNCIFWVVNKKVAKALSFLHIIKRNHHVVIWNCIQKYHFKKIKSRKIRVSEYVVDGIMLKLVQNTFDSGLIFIESKTNEILPLSIFKERNMFVAERFIFDLVKAYGKHSTVSTDDEGI